MITHLFGISFDLECSIWDFQRMPLYSRSKKKSSSSFSIAYGDVKSRESYRPYLAWVGINVSRSTPKNAGMLDKIEFA